MTTTPAHLTRRVVLQTGVGLLGLAALAACGATTFPYGQSTASTAPAASTAASSAPSASAAPSASNAPAASAAPLASAAPSTSGAPVASSGAAPSSAVAPTGTERYAIVPTTSKATYQVNEQLAGRGFNVAQGTTTRVTGDIFVNRQKPSGSSIGTITIDVSAFASDSSQRDNQIRQRWLESNKYPNVTFVAKRLEGLPDAPYTDGQELTFKIIGDLTVRTTTKEVTFDTKAKIIGDTLTGTATTAIQMTDFSFDPPAIANIVTAENGVKFILDLTAKRAS